MITRLIVQCALILGLCLSTHAWSQQNPETTLRRFKYAPFPLNAKQAAKFFDVNQAGRRGHTSKRGGLLWEDITYNDNRVLLAIPADFNRSHPPTLVVFLHGNQSTLERDVLARQQVATQVSAAKINAVLIAPQFAVDALDSNPGNFVQKNYFAAFMKEASAQTGRWQNDNFLAHQLNRAPIIVVAYSGGYYSAAHILKMGGMNKRIKGVILLDALYGEEETFAKWLRANYRKSFFFSTYTEPARASNEALQNILREHHMEYQNGIPDNLRKRTINFIQLDETTVHQDLLTQAWNNQPLTDLLRKTQKIQ